MDTILEGRLPQGQRADNLVAETTLPTRKALSQQSQLLTLCLDVASFAQAVTEEFEVYADSRTYNGEYEKGDVRYEGAHVALKEVQGFETGLQRAMAEIEKGSPYLQSGKLLKGIRTFLDYVIDPFVLVPQSQTQLEVDVPVRHSSSSEIERHPSSVGRAIVQEALIRNFGSERHRLLEAISALQYPSSTGEAVLPFRHIERKEFSGVLSAIIEPDKEAHVVQHTLEPGERINTHLHPQATEWLVFQKGSFELLWGESHLPVTQDGRDTWIAIEIPPKTIHGLIATSKINYFVVRDRADIIEYV
jgi:mannose-6-phosphate isomerase-like protein (cupin superfamily)